MINGIKKVEADWLPPFLYHYLIVTIVAPNPYSWKEAS